MVFDVTPNVEDQRNFRVGVYDECLPLRYTHLWVLYGFICCSPVDLHPREGTLLKGQGNV